MNIYQILEDASFSSKEAACIENLITNIGAMPGKKFFTITVRSIDNMSIHLSDIYSEGDDWFTEELIALLEKKKKSDIGEAIQNLTSVAT